MDEGKVKYPMEESWFWFFIGIGLGQIVKLFT